MQIVKSIETPAFKAAIEQHGEYFIIKYKETKGDSLCTTATQNLTLVLDMFEKLVGKHLTSN